MPNNNNNNNNNFITIVMYYSLFRKQLISHDAEITPFFPKNVFGIFSTVRRGKKIKSYPIDIHGCIGYWDPDFHTLSPTTLYDHLLRVSYDSVWADTRNQYFTPIETEPESVLELDFMLNPIYSINKKSGMIVELNTIFTNKMFGIIIQTTDKTQKATYLPGVFPNISWTNLILSVKKKANITTDEFKLFAYKITQVKSSFTTLLTSDLFTYIAVFNFSRFLIDNKNLNLKFPFIYACKDNKIEWNTNDDVRNISTLGDVFLYMNLYPNIATKAEFNSIKGKVFNILQNIHVYSSQSLSFVGYIYSLFNIKRDLFCKKLLKDLPFSESEFEKPEIIIALNKAGCSLNEKKYVLSYDLNASIFKMNWTIQAIISFNKKPSNKLIIILMTKIDQILTKKKKIETNYLAVAFEALCFIYAKQHTKITLLNKLFELLFELEHRKNCFHALYTFLDKTSRVDITGHVINGLVHLRHHN